MKRRFQTTITGTLLGSLLLLSGSGQAPLRASATRQGGIKEYKLGPGKQTFRVDSTRQLVVTSVPTQTDSPSLDRVYTLHLVQGGKTGISDTWGSYRPPRIHLFRGNDGNRYLFAEISQQASEVVLYRLRGRMLQEVWGDASKGGYILKIHTNGTAEIRMSRLGFQVYGPNDKTAPKYVHEVFRFRNGKVRLVKVVPR